MTDTLGATLKAARGDRGLSLRAVAAQIGVSAALISQIELGHTRPSVSTLYSLVAFFGISLDEVMGLSPSAAGTASPTPVTASPDVSRFRRLSAGDRPSLRMGNGVRWELVASAPGSSAEAVLVTYEPGASSSSDGALMTHPGNEDAYLLSGELSLELEDQAFVLGAGDSFSFDSTRPHRFRNAGLVPATGIWLKLSGAV
jgi:transcriptional regulator with XRE-family HTH domain